TRSRKHAIVTGKPAASELVARIRAGADEVMPPPSTKMALTEAEKATLERWIAAGAVYTAHWAFVPPRRPALPRIASQDWPRNAIDHFVLARLEAEGLNPAPQADQYTLIRRVYLDLVGLPPTPAEVDAFRADPRPDAY